MNCLKPADGRTIEELTDGEEFFIDGGGGDVEVLLDAWQVSETNVKELDIVFLDVGEYFRRVFKHSLHSYIRGIEGPEVSDLTPTVLGGN